MKGKISVILILAMLLASAFIFTSCGKQEPVYTGMSISECDDTVAESSNGIALMSARRDGGVSGDYDGKNEDIDNEDPFQNGSDGENIVDEVGDSLDVVGSEIPIYYAELGEDIFITIHIDNPDNFEIMSFTLNGEKYSSYMFEYGSDMENIILKRNVGYVTGIVEYTIDAIKYVDGTEIKDVKIGGDKTVRAGIRVEDQVTTTVENTEIGTNNISFSANVEDYDSLIAYSKGFIKAVIYDGEEIVAFKDVQLGLNNIAFEGLETNTLYQYGIFAYYDDLSGTGPKVHTLYSNAVYTDAVVLFDNVQIGEEHISFLFKWHQSVANKALVSLKLYKGDTLVKELDVNEFFVDSLLSDNSYDLVAEYMNGGNKESIYIEFTTLKKATPEIKFASSDKTQSSVIFELEENDASEIGEISKIELVHSSGTIAATTTEQRIFENLLSNNDYIIRVTYTYDLNDGTGPKEAVTELDIKTLEKSAPVFELYSELYEGREISADISVVNTDSTLVSYKTALYNGAALVAESQGESFRFTGLEYYKEYTLKISYVYNLNDGQGEKEGVFEKTVKTAPKLNVTDCKIANTSAVSEGETIFLQASLDNPLGLTVKSVTVNGKSYAVTSSSSKDRIFIEIVYSDQFVGGDTLLSIEKFAAEINGESYVITPESILSDSVFINGKLEFLEYKFVNENFEEISWSFPYDKIYVLLVLNNPTGYDVSIPNRNVVLTKLDNNLWYYESTPIGGALIYNIIPEINYSNEYISGSAAVKKHNYLRVVESNEIKYVSTPEDLLNMNEGYYYELTGDIDLSGIEWIPGNFTGVFDGKGYAIKNMSFVKTLDRFDGNFHFGLFKKGVGVIKNLNIKDATIIVDIKANDYNAYLGGIVAHNEMEFLDIENCTTDKNSVFSIKNSGYTYAGCLAGYVNRGHIDGCENNASINVNSENAYSACAGGLLGHLDMYIFGTEYYFENSYITNCTNNGSVTSSGQAGGLVGGVCATIEGCTNNGNVNGLIAGGIAAYGKVNAISCVNNGRITSFTEQSNVEPFAGGLFASLFGFITDCINNGEVSATSGGTAVAGGIFGKSSDAFVHVNRCTNNGKVSAISVSAGAYNAFAGGIMGRGYADISASTNNGEIVAKSNEAYRISSAGGIVGILTEDTYIKNCLNTAKISADFAGGILGKNDYIFSEKMICKISNCINVGIVDAIYNGGGIVACVTYPYDAVSKVSFEISDCINRAKVSVSVSDYGGNKIIGGILGTYLADRDNVTNCYSVIVYHRCDVYCTADEISSGAFYKNKLNFSDEIWDFTDIDANAEKYPTIK